MAAVGWTKKSISSRYPIAARLALVTLCAVNVAADAVAAQKALKKPKNQVTFAEREIGEPIQAVVSIKSQEITFYDAEGWIWRAPVSTGMTGRETPAGIFAVLEKKEDHRSNLYDDARMPYMHRLTWNGIAIHGGELPGRPASKGCVRLPFDFAPIVFSQTQMGMRVIISPDDVTPVEISHPALLTPNPDMVAEAPERADRLARAAQDAAQAARDAKAAREAATKNVKALTAELRKLERQAADADAELIKAENALDRAESGEAREKAKERWVRADDLALEAVERLKRAKRDIEAARETEAAAKDAAQQAAERSLEAEKAAEDARLALEPVSVYVNRATGMVYVRRNTRKPLPDGGELYDFSIESPIAIRDPERPIGTHIFTAMAADDSGKLRWSGVTIDQGDEARNALDRITIPKHILDRIAPTARPRSSIVISDEPLSAETNYRTEFVAVLSNHPQGGFETRPRTVSRSYRVSPVAVRRPSWVGDGFFSFGYLEDAPRPQPSVRKPGTNNRKPAPPPKKNFQFEWW